MGLLALAAVVLAPAFQHPTVAPEFRARCTLADGGLERVPSWIAAQVRALEAHERAHGWRRDGHDVFEGRAAARCPDEVPAWFEHRAGERPAYLTELAALALERNGHAARALDLVAERLAEFPPDPEVVSAPSDATLLAIFGARLALHAGQFERALALLPRWGASGWCGTCTAGDEHERDVARADAWVGLGRRAELIELARTPPYGFGDAPSAELVRRWVQLDQREHGEGDPAAAIERVTVALADARLVATVMKTVASDLAALAAPESLPVERLPGLAHSVPEAVRRRVMALDAEQRAAALAVARSQLRAPTVHEWKWHPLVRLYAELGVPELGPELDAHRADAPDDAGLQELADTWAAWNDAWRVWTAR